jgi:hypothetical protein
MTDVRSSSLLVRCKRPVTDVQSTSFCRSSGAGRVHGKPARLFYMGALQHQSLWFLDGYKVGQTEKYELPTSLYRA